MFIIKEKDGKMHSLPTKEVTTFPRSPLAIRILSLLAKQPSYPRELAGKLGVHEQKIYYHIRKLEHSGIIGIVKKEERGGAVAKFYALTKPSFFMRFSEFNPTARIPRAESSFIQPFIIDNKINTKIIVGSLDPHGPEHARSRDLSYAMDFAIFFGTFLTKVDKPSIMTDTEARKADLNDNLILIAKKILLIAGKRYTGTRAAILAIINDFENISKKSAHVVEGIDADSDGVIDSVRILE
ncbi:MAG: winged helix-turn-helix domain-containing protein [Candidatus Aenigmarchaeota archaeon]|nr:winged helix-turn-helix domain-containing protein [Candidatus Aenigmarchaeota archaeon]